MISRHILVWEGDDDRRHRAALEEQDASFRAAVIAAHPRFAPKVITLEARPNTANAGPKRKVHLIIAEVAKKHDLQPKDLTSKGSMHHIVRARQEAAYRLRKEVTVLGDPMSLPQIGAALGYRDHSSVVHGIAAHEQRMSGGK